MWSLKFNKLNIAACISLFCPYCIVSTATTPFFIMVAVLLSTVITQKIKHRLSTWTSTIYKECINTKCACAGNCRCRERFKCWNTKEETVSACVNGHCKCTNWGCGKVYVCNVPVIEGWSSFWGVYVVVVRSQHVLVTSIFILRLCFLA